MLVECLLEKNVEGNYFTLVSLHLFYYRKHSLYEAADGQEESLNGFTALKEFNELNYSDLSPFLKALYPHHYNDIQSRSKERSEDGMYLAKTAKEVYDISNFIIFHI